MLGIKYAYLMIKKLTKTVLNLFKMFFKKNDYEEEIEENSFRTRKKIKKILKQEIKVQEIRKVI